MKVAQGNWASFRRPSLWVGNREAAFIYFKSRMLAKLLLSLMKCLEHSNLIVLSRMTTAPLSNFVFPLWFPDRKNYRMIRFFPVIFVAYSVVICSTLNRKKSFGLLEKKWKRFSGGRWCGLPPPCVATALLAARSRSSSSSTLWCLGTRLFKWLTKGAFYQTKKSRESSSQLRKSHRKTLRTVWILEWTFYQRPVDLYFIKVCQAFQLI